jgi:hypothetical protein
MLPIGAWKWLPADRLLHGGGGLSAQSSMVCHADLVNGAAVAHDVSSSALADTAFANLRPDNRAIPMSGRMIDRSPPDHTVAPAVGRCMDVAAFLFLEKVAD